MFYKTNYKSPIKNITLASDGISLIGLWFENQKYFGSTIREEMIPNDDLKIFSLTKNWLDKYFNREKPNIRELPLKLAGTDFRQRVWQILCEIPYGTVVTYNDIAKIITKERCGKVMSAQAIGGAVGHNPVSIIIPCHRVAGSNGSLTGYAGGIETKIKLLEHEDACKGGILQFTPHFSEYK